MKPKLHIGLDASSKVYKGRTLEFSAPAIALMMYFPVGVSVKSSAPCGK